MERVHPGREGPRARNSVTTAYSYSPAPSLAPGRALSARLRRAKDWPLTNQGEGPMKSHLGPGCCRPTHVTGRSQLRVVVPEMLMRTVDADGKLSASDWRGGSHATETKASG